MNATLIRADGTTTCCNAFTTFCDATEVCKGCFNEIDGLSDEASCPEPKFLVDVLDTRSKTTTCPKRYPTYSDNPHAAAYEAIDRFAKDSGMKPFGGAGHSLSRYYSRFHVTVTNPDGTPARMF